MRGHPNRRKYGHCAKCGKEKPLSSGTKCPDCLDVFGPNRYCCVCGGPFSDQSIRDHPRDYVCWDDLVVHPHD